jgi:hypothetical protein
VLVAEVSVWSLPTLGLAVFLGMTALTPCFRVSNDTPLFIAIDISDDSIVARYTSCANALHCPKDKLFGSADVCSFTFFQPSMYDWVLMTVGISFIAFHWSCF